MRLVRLFRFVHWGALGLLLGFLAFKAVYRGGVMWEFDFYAYHSFMGLTKVGFDPYYFFGGTSIWNDFYFYIHNFLPPLIYYVQYTLLAVTGKFWWMNLSSLLFVLAGLGFVGKLEGERVARWWITAMLAIPQFIINLPSGLTDIPSNVVVSCCALVLTRILCGDDSKRTRAIFYALAFAGVLCKLQMWFPVLFLLFIYFCFVQYGLWKLERAGFFSRKRLPVIVMCTLIMCFWPMKNLITIGDPLAPVVKPTYLKILYHEGYKAAEKWKAENPHENFGFLPLFTPEILKDATRPVRYAFSYFELTRFLTDEPMTWNSSGWHGSEKSAHQMMGGMNGLYMGLLMAAFALCIYSRAIPKRVTLLVVLIYCFASIMPQSHEMRYWMFAPFILMLMLVKYAPNARYGRVAVYGAIAIGCITTFSSKEMGKMNVFGVKSTALFITYPEIPNFWKTHTPNTIDTPYCLPTDTNKTNLAIPMGITFTGPNLQTYYVRDCSQDKRKK